jgi:MFS family permease
VRPLLVFACAVVFVDTVFYAAITPLLPGYVEDLGLSRAQAGVLAAAYPAGTFLAAVPAGWLAGRAGTRATTLAGLGLMTAASVVFATHDAYGVLVAARFVQGIGGAASWAGALGWVVEATTGDRRGQTIGVVMAAAIAGALCGPVLGATAEALGAAPVFGAVAAIGAGLTGVALRLPGRPPVRADLATVLAALRDPATIVPLWLTTLPGLLFGTLGVLGPLRLDELGAGATAIAAVFVCAGALEAAVNPVAGRIADRRGRRGPILAGVGVTALLIGLVALPRSAWLLALLVIAVTPAIGILWTPAAALLSDAADRRGIAQGLALAIMNLAWALGQTAGAAGSGRLADAAGEAVPYVVLAVTCAVTFAVLRTRRALLPQGALTANL